MAKTFASKIDQIPEEIDGFIALLERENVLSYLEIGSQYGGSFYKVATSLPKGSRVVSIDLPHGDHQTMMPLKECVTELRGMGYDARVIFGDSTAPQIVKTAQLLGPFDAVFIDANHSLPYVTQDWRNYGLMGRLVAFHDIAFVREVRPGRMPIEVSKLWRVLKLDYINSFQEFIAPGSEKGIGVIWH